MCWYAWRNFDDDVYFRGMPVSIEVENFSLPSINSLDTVYSVDMVGNNWHDLLIIIGSGS
jgi:hypothetical protein